MGITRTMRVLTWKARAALLMTSLFVALMNPTAAAQGVTPGKPEAQTEDATPAGLINIGGRRLYLECRGSGSPTVVLEAGYRSPATVWSDDLSTLR